MTPEPIWKLKSFDTNFPALQKKECFLVSFIAYF